MHIQRDVLLYLLRDICRIDRNRFVCMDQPQLHNSDQ
uniref:Uncharacterized protein n=1 Tax=Ascaris lumbricoides TaxID=6252 RepID=A0A0M3HFN3_ASCLU